MSFLLPDSQVVPAYLDFRDRVAQLIREIPESQAANRVPLCPDWAVRSLIAHIVGVPEDIMAGRMEGVTTDAWTQAQVDRHATESLLQLADSLLVQAVDFDKILPFIPSPINSQLVMDSVTHEHDLRQAIGRAGAQDSSAIDVALGWLLDMVEGRLPGLAHDLLGMGVSSYDLVRSLTGRRSIQQMDRLGLNGRQIVELLQGTPLKPPLVDIEI